MNKQLHQLRPLQAFRDNYVWVFSTGEGQLAAVDPGQAQPVEAELARRGARLSHLLLTHFHPDHCGGVLKLEERHGPIVVGAAADRARLPPLDLALEGGEELQLGQRRCQVLAVPGHTRADLAYLVEGALFSGDALFSFGCGRLFEGDARQMWNSMKKLRALPDETLLCCGHEYTVANLHFARHLEPDSEALEAAWDEALERQSEGLPTLPTPLGEQKRLNPFLRCDDADFARSLDLQDLAAGKVFAEIRSRKDRF